MVSDSAEKVEVMRRLRDEKVRVHLEQYAPVWMVSETALPAEETLRFDVVFMHPRYGWVNRRYRYDAFNDVLYYNGQRRIDEKDALDVQEYDAYIPAETINTLESYGG